MTAVNLKMEILPCIKAEAPFMTVATPFVVVMTIWMASLMIMSCKPTVN